MSDWHLYMIRCHDGSLYTGVAIDVARRFAEHEMGVGAKYVRGRGPLKLVLVQRVGSRGEALRLEQRVKRLPKPLKERLLAGDLGLGDIPT